MVRTKSYKEWFIFLPQWITGQAESPGMVVDKVLIPRRWASVPARGKYLQSPPLADLCLLLFAVIASVVMGTLVITFFSVVACVCL